LTRRLWPHQGYVPVFAQFTTMARRSSQRQSATGSLSTGLDSWIPRRLERSNPVVPSTTLRADYIADLSGDQLGQHPRPIPKLATLLARADEAKDRHLKL